MALGKTHMKILNVPFGSLSVRKISVWVVYTPNLGVMPCDPCSNVNGGTAKVPLKIGHGVILHPTLYADGIFY